jgi:large subunit ribosomal protein L22
MAAGQATLRYLRTSAQKAALVLDQIRGRDVTRALATLRFSRKLVARDVEKVLRSAVANVQQQEGFGGDVDQLYVARCWAGQGPSMKRIRPAPMGRAFRVVKRTAHLTVEVAERPVKAAARSARPARAGTRARAKSKTGEAKDQGTTNQATQD